MDTWFLLAVTGPLWGFLFWLVFTRPHGFLYLEGLGAKLSFFFGPWMPKWYVLLKHIDGKVEQFFELGKTRIMGKSVIELDGPEGVAWITMDKDPDEVAVPLSIWDARGPPGMPSPYGLAWRAIVGWAVAVYVAFLAWDFTFLSAVAKGAAIPVEGWLSLTVFMVEFNYLWQLFARMNTPMTKYLGLVVVGINPPVYRAVPEISVFDPRSPAELLGMLGRRLEVVVSDRVRDVVERLLERLGTEKDVVASLLAKLDLCIAWRKSVSELRVERTGIRAAARRELRMMSLRSEIRPTFGRLLVWLLFFGLGAIVGYVFGSSWALSASPPPWYSASMDHSTTYYNNSMYTVQTPPVSPAYPPSPPVPSQTSTPVSPAAPPPPPSAGNSTAPMQPAPAPPPPGGG